MGKKKLRNGDKLKVNDPCPCGSGKKYKRCCKDKPQPESLSPNQLKVVPLSKVPPELLKSLQEKKVVEEQRIAQQGRGAQSHAGPFLVEAGDAWRRSAGWNASRTDTM